MHIGQHGSNEMCSSLFCHLDDYTWLYLLENGYECTAMPPILLYQEHTARVVQITMMICFFRLIKVHRV